MREADIRPADLLNKYLRLSAEDAISWFADDAMLAKRRCPGCGSGDPTVAFVKAGFTFVTCKICQTLYANPVPVNDQLLDFYRNSPSQKYWGETFFPAVAEARREHIFRPRVANIMTLLSQMSLTVGPVVDVGAGAGIFLEEAAAAGLGTKRRAIEPNGTLAAVCRGKGFDTYEGFAVEAASDPAWSEKAKLVTCFEVIEHVPNPMNFVAELTALAAPGGLILFTGLCASGFDIITLGRHSKAVSPPHHLNFLSRRGAEALLDRIGLESLQFLTPGELDVDIVTNIDREHGGLVQDPFIRYILDVAGQDIRDNFQRFLSDNGLSSHMWVVARKPA